MRTTQLLEVRERTRIRHGIAAQAHGQVVTAVLAFRPDAARQPPDGRVIEQERLEQRLQQVHEIVVPADMCELVGQDRFDLQLREA